jgi:hypothetical protein
MDQKDRIDLKKLMQHQSDDYEDNTEGIRRLKHSDLIIADVFKIESLKVSMKREREEGMIEFQNRCQTECSFLYNKYTDIFNRLINDELDIELLSNMLATLKKIEDGKINQQEGSVIIGKILHKIYVESALKKGEKISKENDSSITDEVPKVEAKPISWKEFKKQQKK